jgi:quinol monooxygenase YgiN
MLIQVVHFTFAPEDADRAAEMLRELRAASRAEPGVIGFDIGRSPDKPEVFALWEVYRDRSALDTHKSSAHFERLVANGVRPLSKERSAVILDPI